MAEHEIPDMIIPDNSDIQEGAIKVSIPVPNQVSDDDYTEAGDYIPIGGGTRGWFENSGVSLVEDPNNYRFFEAIDEDAFRRHSIETVQKLNVRASKRFESALPIRISTDDGVSEEPGFCLDLSITGAQLRTRQDFEQESLMQITISTPRDSGEEKRDIVTVPAKVMWCTVATQTRNTVRYLCGIQFEPMGLPEQQALATLLH